MGFKTITVQDEIFDILSALKGPNRSFNDLFKEFIEARGDITPLFGIIDDDEAEKLLQAIQKLKNEKSDSVRDQELLTAWH